MSKVSCEISMNASNAPLKEGSPGNSDVFLEDVSSHSTQIHKKPQEQQPHKKPKPNKQKTTIQ